MGNLADGGFDLGPLTWVKDEIDSAIEKGLASLADFEATATKGAPDRTPLKQAQSHIHQAAGAVQIVGLDGPITLLEEVERHLLLLETAPREAVGTAVAAIGAASRRLVRYLDDLAQGEAPVTLRLYPDYLQLCRLRGNEGASPTDLFFPDLTRAPRHLAAGNRPRPHPPDFLRSQRRLYQRGLLRVLKGEVAPGVAAMRQSVQSLEEALTGTASASFWWTVGGFLATVADRNQPPSNAVKQLFARIDLQIRRFVEGSAKVSDRLRREVLYHIATSPPSSPRVQEIQSLYGLPAMLPKESGERSVDIERIRPQLKRSQELVASVQEQWLRYTGGRREVLLPLRQALDELEQQVGQLGEASLANLAAALKRVAMSVPPEGTVPEPVAMEFATAVLLASDALAHFARLSPDFPRQSEAMCRRIDLALRGVVSLPGAGEDLLDETARRAQERLLLSNVAREIQANLRHVEKVLDAFFRDPAERAELSTLARYTGQIQGALQILGLDEASELLNRCQKQIDAYCAGRDPDSADLEQLAESLSGLGFYIEAVEQQRPDAVRILDPFFGRSASAPEPAAPAVETKPGGSIESDLEAHRNELPATVARLRASPDNPALRAELNNQLQSLKQDADLVADTDFSSHAASALQLLHDEKAPADQVLATLDDLALDAPAQAPEPSQETKRLLAAGEGRLDLELSDIFVTEARTVLESFGESLATLSREPASVDALTELRRGFHTLKGSGRMVGQAELGESAWQVEKFLNRWLDDERPASPDLVAMLQDARGRFGGWIEALAKSGFVSVDDRPLREAIARLEAQGDATGDTKVDAKVDTKVGDEGEAKVDERFDEKVEENVEESVEENVDERADIRHQVTGHALPTTAVLDDLAHHAPAVAPAVAGQPTAVLPLGIDSGLLLDLEPVAPPAVGPKTTAVAPTAAEAPFELAPPIELETPVEAVAAPAAAPAVEAEDIVIGTVRLSPVLYETLLEETANLLQSLEREHATLQFDSAALPSDAMIRAAHTLHGIQRTSGFAPLADTAKALESALTALANAGRRPDATVQVLAEAIESLNDLADFIGMRRPFDGSSLERAAEARVSLEALSDAALGIGAGGPVLDRAAPGPAAEPVVPGVTDSLSGPVEPAAAPVASSPIQGVSTPALAEDLAREHGPAEAESPVSGDPALDPMRARADALASVRDEVDPDLARIFLDEANELFPRAGSLLRDWRRSPSTRYAASELKRTLHTLKGSARMAGAMRLGELAHLMETRLEDLGERQPSPELLETLDADLDSQAALIEALQEQLSRPAAADAATRARTETIADTTADATADARAATDTTATAATPLVAGIAAPEAAVPSAPAGHAPIAASTSFASPAGAAAAAASAVAAAAAVVTGAATAHGTAAAASPAVARGTAVEASPAETPQETAAQQQVTVRVKADIIDRLVNETGEVSIARARIEGELRSLKSNLLELTNSVIRLRSQVREIEMQAETQIQSRMSQGSEKEGFDPLEFDRFTRFQELSRGLAEGVNDVATVQQALIRNLDDADAALMAQARLSRDVQQQLLAVRTVPFASVSDRLYRVLRQTAKELDKKVNLDIKGGQTELDRGVLDKLMPPLEHLLRNAIDHGIEEPAARARRAKPEAGEVVITVRQEGNEIALTLADDGGGLPLPQIKAKAIELGLIARDATPTDSQLIDAIFAPGFTTAQEVSRISGRGIGMDVVRNDIHSLGGRIEVATTEGKGTVFTLYLPLTLAVTQAVLVRASGRIHALPAALVEQVQQVKADNLVRAYAAGTLSWQSRAYPFHYLPKLLGDADAAPDPQRYNPVLLLKSANQNVAIHVDEMIGNQEIVIKNIGAQLARLPGLAGATVLGTGEIVLILNPVQLLARHARAISAAQAAAGSASGAGDAAGPGAPPLEPHVALAESRHAPTVLVVDDSLTVRKITSRLLAREGYDVASARDGVDALQWLAEQSADVILLDIEMPRMDGFEFAKTARADPRLAAIPIIMITSRTAEKHRARAAELGIEAYLGKPFQEDDLLRQVRKLSAKRSPSDRDATAPSPQEA